MAGVQDNKIMPLHSQESGQVERPSIFAELDKVKAQVEYQCLEQSDPAFTDPLYHELCLIIAEVNLLSDSKAITVAGASLPASIVQEVYSALRCEHLQRVAYNFKRVSWEVARKKAYLRTALYNAVFELESGYANQLALWDRRNG